MTNTTNTYTYTVQTVTYQTDVPFSLPGEAQVVAHVPQERLLKVLVRTDGEPEPATTFVEQPTCAGKGGECSRTVNASGDRCWQHPEDDDE